ncbi:MAG: RHS repeat-associated core domain-containing protein, partial [Paludibacter sp.]|nr:RHS repeat-associated core domain-containing protein [Paludibacter sp.]
MQQNNTLYYVHTDRQGSLERITNTSGTIVTAYAYTPWGGRILLSGVNITDCGYTGHEHLVALNLINMNGRVYDPVLARFLSPDPYVQAPDFTQSFNRYAYCLNNPFKYVDPSGEFLTWSINSNGFSIGLNFCLAGVPLGFGISVGFSGGGSVGIYGEVGYRVGCVGV